MENQTTESTSLMDVGIINQNNSKNEIFKISPIMKKRKIADIENPQFTHPIATKSTKINENPNPIQIQNKFVSAKNIPIENDMNVEPTVQVPDETLVKKMKPPPIIIHGSFDEHRKMDAFLARELQDTYYWKHTKESTILQTQSLRDWELIKGHFDRQNTNYHTYTPKTLKTHSFILRGLHHKIDINDIQTQLTTQHKIPVTKIFAMSGTNYPSYLIITDNTVTLNSIQKIKHVDHTFISWERHTNNKIIIQCHRCQRWGHATSNCRAPPRCLKCAKDHLTKTCTKPRNEPAICVNCKGAHTANNVVCPVYQNRLQQKQIANTRTPPAPNTRYVAAPQPKTNVWHKQSQNVHNTQNSQNLQYNQINFPSLAAKEQHHTQINTQNSCANISSSQVNSSQSYRQDPGTSGSSTNTNLLQAHMEKTQRARNAIAEFNSLMDLDEIIEQVYANRRAKALLENDEVDSVGTKNGHLKNEPQTKGDAKVRNNSLVQMTPSDWYSVKQVNKYMKDIRHCKEFTRAVYEILKNEQEVGKTLDGNKNTLLERYRKYLSERQMNCAPNNDEENGLERASSASHSCTKKNMSSEGQSIEKENEGNCKCPNCQMKERHSAQGSKDNKMDEATPGCSKYKDYDFGYSLPSTQKTNMKKELPVSSEGKENEDNCNCCNRENKLDYTASPFPNKNKIKSSKRILVDNTEENMENKNSMKDESCQDLESSTCSSSTSKAKRARQQLFSDDEDENMEEIDGQVKIGPGGTTVPKKIFKKIEWSKHTTATRKLLMEIFPRSVLSTHSLTGKPSPAFLNSGKDAKMRLDPIKTADIVECVSRRCKVTPSIVRNAITTKCADENKLYRKQLEKNKAAKRDDAYNVKPEGTIFN